MPFLVEAQPATAPFFRVFPGAQLRQRPPGLRTFPSAQRERAQRARKKRRQEPEGRHAFGPVWLQLTGACLAPVSVGFGLAVGTSAGVPLRSAPLCSALLRSAPLRGGTQGPLAQKATPALLVCVGTEAPAKLHSTVGTVRHFYMIHSTPRRPQREKHRARKRGWARGRGLRGGSPVSLALSGLGLQAQRRAPKHFCKHAQRLRGRSGVVPVS